MPLYGELGVIMWPNGTSKGKYPDDIGGSTTRSLASWAGGLEGGVGRNFKGPAISIRAVIA